MQLEIRKENNRYVLINPPEGIESHFWVEVEADKIISIPVKMKNTESIIYQTIKEMAKKYPDNKFLKISLELTPTNYTYNTDMSNENLLNEALTEKYGI